MRISSVIGLYFSPTGTTRTLVTAAAEQAAQTLGVPFRLISLNTPAERETVFHFSADTLVIVGAPTYAGRLPNKISPDLRRILHGSGSPAVALVTYGNRAYENALAELFRVLTDGGMKPAARMQRTAPRCAALLPRPQNAFRRTRSFSPLPCRATQTAAIISRPARAGSPRNFSSLHRRPILKNATAAAAARHFVRWARSAAKIRLLFPVSASSARPASSAARGGQNFSTTNSFCPMRACLNRSLPGYIRKTSFICKKRAKPASAWFRSSFIFGP